MQYPPGGSTRYLMRMPATPLCVNFEEKVPIDAVIKSDSFSDLTKHPTNGTSWDIEFDAASVVNDVPVGCKIRLLTGRALSSADMRAMLERVDFDVDEAMRAGAPAASSSEGSIRELL